MVNIYKAQVHFPNIQLLHKTLEHFEGKKY